MGLYQAIRNIDLFPTPIGIRYLDAKYYRTFCGGALSILAFSMIIIFSLTELSSFLDGNQYNESVVIETLSYNNEIEYKISDEQAMVAF